MVSNASASASAPEPFATARSMLSFGIEYDFAFSIAFWSALLLAGSPPPSFAATMIARVSFEKSFPRFASAAPFLCLIDDHLLCPDKRRLLHGFEEQLVEPRVCGQFRMERGDEEAALAREHGMPVELGQHLDRGPGLVDPRRADEHGPQRLAPARQLEIGLERRDLPAERVPPDAHVDEPEVVAVEHDHPRARAEDRPREAAHGVVEGVEAHQARERRRLAAGDHEPVETVELVGLPHLDGLRAERAQHRRVLAEVALHGQHPDAQRSHGGGWYRRAR